MNDIVEDDEKLINCKKMLYHLFYMDNGSFTSDNDEQINWVYNSLNSIFNPYGFSIQQVVTNDLPTQALVDESKDSITPDESKLLGIMWNKSTDILSCAKLHLDASASTKRTILSSIASNYDIFNFNLPLLNRAKLYLCTCCNAEKIWTVIPNCPKRKFPSGKTFPSNSILVPKFQ